MVVEQTATPIIRDPRWYKTLLYARSGVGKTTWAAGIEGHYFIKTEDGTAGVQVFGTNVLSWKDITDLLEEILGQKAAGWKTPEGVAIREIKTIVIDTGDNLYQLGSRYICETRTFPEKGINHKFERIEDVPYGKGYKAVAELLSTLIETIRLKGFGIVLLCHSKEYIKKWRGEEFTAYRPNFPPSSVEILMGACDCVGYMEVDEDYEKNVEGVIIASKSHHLLHWQPHFLFEAKHRLKQFPSPAEVPLENGYQAYEAVFEETLLKLETV